MDFLVILPESRKECSPRGLLTGIVEELTHQVSLARLQRRTWPHVGRTTCSGCSAIFTCPLNESVLSVKDLLRLIAILHRYFTCIWYNLWPIGAFTSFITGAVLLRFPVSHAAGVLPLLLPCPPPVVDPLPPPM